MSKLTKSMFKNCVGNSLPEGLVVCLFWFFNNTYTKLINFMITCTYLFIQSMTLNSFDSAIEHFLRMMSPFFISASILQKYFRPWLTNQIINSYLWQHVLGVTWIRPVYFWPPLRPPTGSWSGLCIPPSLVPDSPVPCSSSFLASRGSWLAGLSPLCQRRKLSTHDNLKQNKFGSTYAKA